MSIDERTSPRANIRSWLLKADSTAKPKFIQAQRTYSKSTHKAAGESRHLTHSSDASPATRVQVEKTHAVHHRRRNGRDSPYQRAKHTSQFLREDHHRVGGPGIKSKHYERSLTERLGLQGPLRAFGENIQPPVEVGRPRKRQRRDLSVSSDLQPALIAELECTPNDAEGVQHVPRAEKSHHVRPIKCNATLSEHSKHSTILFSSPKEPIQTYERRNRHKTREDRYEIKRSAARQSKTPLRTRKETKPIQKQRHTEKSGGALMHDFTAPNIPNDRLTLRPGKPVGLFGRGKASSPVKRRGLPDLAFSELAFLNTSHCKPEEVTESTNKEEERKTKKARRAADMEAEISRYFIAGKTRKPGNTEAVSDGLQSEEQRQSNLRDLAPPVNELPGAPFLGFGTSGANSVLSVINVKELDARYVPQRSQRATGSPSRSTSYLTWSQSSTAPPVPKRQGRSPTTKRPNVATRQKRLDFKTQTVSSSNRETIHNDRLIKGPPKQPSRTTAAPLSAEDVPPVAKGISRQRLSTPMRNAMDWPTLQDAERAQRSPNPGDVSSSKASQTHVPAPRAAAASIGSNDEADARFEALKLVACPLPQPLAIQEAYDTIQATVDALLQACKAKLPETTTENTNLDTRAETREMLYVASEEPDRLKQVSSHTAPKTSVFQQVELHNDSQLADKNSYSGLGNPSRRFDQGDQPHQPLGKLTKDRPITANNLFCRPRTTGIIRRQNPYAQKSPINSIGLLTSYDNFYERQRKGQARAVGRSQGYALNTENCDHGRCFEFDVHGRFQGMENVSLPHAQALPDESIPICEPGEDRFDDIEQEELAENQQTYADTTSTYYQKARHYSTAAPLEWPAKNNLPLMDQNTLDSGIYEPPHFRTFEDTQNVDFDTTDRRQSRRFNAGLANSLFVSRTPLPTRGQRRDTLQARPESAIHGDSGIQPEGFWKPNRLY